MAHQLSYQDLDLVPRGYKRNPDWVRDFREDQDKITKVVNGILDMTLKNYIGKENTMLSDIYFTKYWGVGNYCFVYKLKTEYNRTEVLVSTIVESTDEILKWYDLTTINNFTIIMVTPHRTIVKTYLDLLYECVTMKNYSRFTSVKNLIQLHPRIQLMKRWVIYNKEYDRITEKCLFYHDLCEKQIEFLQIRNDVDTWKKRIISEEFGVNITPFHKMSETINSRVEIEKKSGIITKLMNKLKTK